MLEPDPLQPLENTPTPTFLDSLVLHVLHVLHGGNDIHYDRETGSALLPVRVCFRDGTAVRTALQLRPGEVQLLCAQLERALALRARHLTEDLQP
ncbi:hypothetical protein AB0O22_17015 [Streptomyces sp. NPDC091204]|uniref:hypothetical protein n=1 Tax=Streptomyces sp. NPDC091204 TaxID=3155299 RepID=UPI00341F9635